MSTDIVAATTDSTRGTFFSSCRKHFGFSNSIRRRAHTFDLEILTSIDGMVLKEIFKSGSDWAKRFVKHQGIEREKIKRTIERLRASWRKVS